MNILSDEKEKLREECINRLNSVIEKSHILNGRGGDAPSYLQLSTLIASSHLAITQCSPKGNHFHKVLETCSPDNNWDAMRNNANTLVGIVLALKEAYTNDYLSSIEEIIHAETFSDFIESAENLLQDGHYLPSAVVIGSVLENHLKELSLKNSLALTGIDKKSGKEFHLKASALNIELARNNIYNKVRQQQITGYLAIRNEAAHGNFNEFNEADVKQMLAGVREFLLNYPA